MASIMRGAGGDATEEFLTSLSGAARPPRRYTPGMRVLVVEDERKVAKALREGLEAERYDVSVAASGEEGFFLVNREIVDLVLLDLMLPRRNGIEVHGDGGHKGGDRRRRVLVLPTLVLLADQVIE